MVVVIVPYANRPAQLEHLLLRLHQQKGIDQVIVCQPVTSSPFNRGWVKNVGFLLAQVDPSTTVYFHDVDLLTGLKLSTLKPAPPHKVLHLYGHPHCLGGIVGMRAADFMMAGGFVNDRPTWGGEDRYLRQSCIHVHIDVPLRPVCLRFQDDMYVREMDLAGRPMSGLEAMQKFKRELETREKIPAPPKDASLGHLATTKFTLVDRLIHPNFSKVVLFKVAEKNQHTATV